jgi:hypothetical protein
VANYRQRKITGELHVMADLPHKAELQPPGPGPVELGVAKEIDELASQARPGLAQAALALARILDNPKAINQQPAAARQLVAVLNALSKRAQRRGKLAAVKSMTTSGQRAD